MVAILYKLQKRKYFCITPYYSKTKSWSPKVAVTFLVYANEIWGWAKGNRASEANNRKVFKNKKKKQYGSKRAVPFS